MTSVMIQPRPVQRELPVWLTCASTPERFSQAGARGFNVLTALIFQPIEQLAQRIADYRSARSRGGHDPTAGKVTLMLHTFVGDTIEKVRDLVREPMKNYLRSSVDLWKGKYADLEKLGRRPDALEFAFQRYFDSCGLFGTPDSCAKRILELTEVGVDEIACLLDYGVDAALVLKNLEGLNQLRQRFDEP